MALTEKEKARNKEFHRARNKAHSARLKLFRSAEERGEAAIVAKYEAEGDAADAAYDAAFERRDVTIKEIQDQINALRDRLNLEKTGSQKSWTLSGKFKGRSMTVGE